MATYYVATNGNDTVSPANNSLSSPWKTLHLSANKLAAGDTLYIRGGVYSLPVNGEITLSPNNVTFAAYNGENVIIDGRTTFKSTLYNTSCVATNPIGTTEYQPLVKLSGSGVTVDGITVRNTAGEGIKGVGSENSLIVNCTAYNIFSSGFRHEQASHGSEIRDCLAYDCCLRGGRATVAGRDSTGLTMLRVTLHHSGGEGLNMIWCRDSLIQDCVAYDNQKVQIYLDGCGGTDIDGCTIYCTDDIVGGDIGGSAGIEITSEIYDGVSSDSYDLTIVNNIIAGCSPNLFIQGGMDSDEKRPWLGRIPVPNWGMNNITVAHNTIVNARGQAGVSFFNKISENNANNDTCWFLNNVIVQDNSLPIFTTLSTTDLSQWVVKNNLWSKLPIADMRDSTQIIGGANLAAAPAAMESSADFSVNHYKLTQSSPARNAGTTAYEGASGVTVSVDFFDAARSGLPDIGFHEFDGSVEDAITAAFSLTSGYALSGGAPLAVSLDNDSTATNAIVQSTWSMGDGTTYTVNGDAGILHTYTDAGTYTVTLTVRDANNLSDTETKTDYVAVSTPGGEAGAGNVAYKVGSFAASTSTSAQTVTHGLSELPKAFVFAPSGATAVDTAADDAMLSFGAAAGSGQWSVAIWSDNGVTTTETKRYQSDQRAISLLINGTAYTAEVSWDDTDLTVTWDSVPPSAMLIGYWAIGGAAVQAHASTPRVETQDTSVSVSTGFAPTVVITGTTHWVPINYVNPNAPLSLGVLRSGGQTGASIWFRRGQSAAEATARIDTGYLGTHLQNATPRLQGGLTGSGYTLTPKEDDLDAAVGALALRIDGPSIYCALVDTPTSTGNDDNTAPALELGSLLTIATALQATDSSVTTGDAGTMAVSLYDGTTEVTVGASDEDGEATTDAQSLIADDLTIAADDGSTLFAGATTFVTDGYRRAMTTTDGTARKWLVLGFESTSDNPIAGFSVLPLTGQVDVTEFVITDLSDDNGLGTITYSYDWDDGSDLDTTAEPTHTYDTAGTYTIEQTVTAGGNSDTYSVDVTVTGAGATVDFDVTGTNDAGYIVVGNIATFTADVTAASGKTISNYAWQIYTGSKDAGSVSVPVYTTSGAAVTSFSRIMATEGTFGVQLTVTQSDGLVTVVYDDEAVIVTSLALPDFTIELASQGTTASDGTIEAGTPATVTITDASSSENDVLERVFTITNSAGTVVDTITGKSEFDYTFVTQDTYSIALEVTVAGGSTSTTKTNAVAVLYGEVDIVGPPYPADVDTWTRSQVRGDYQHTHKVVHTVDGDANTLLATDTRGGTAVDYLAVGATRDSVYNAAAAPRLLVDGYAQLDGIAGDSVTLRANALEPYASYSVDLGSQANKFGAVYAANLRVETLVAQEVKADIGGRVIIGLTNTLEADVLASAGTSTTIIYTYDNGPAYNDYIWFEAGGKYEIMQVKSAVTSIKQDDGTTVYQRSVIRVTTDANGASILHDWPKGSAFINMGGLLNSSGAVIQTGWIDLYARTSMREKGDETLDGPTIVGNVRYGPGVYDYAATYALGNLRGRYGQTSAANVWGVAVGWDRDNSAYMVAKPAAISFYGSGREELMQFSAYDGLKMFAGATSSVRNALSFVNSENREIGSFAAWDGGDSDRATGMILFPSENADSSVVFAAYDDIDVASTKILAKSSGAGTISLAASANASYKTIIIDGLPTSASGLPTGALYSDSGTIKIVT